MSLISYVNKIHFADGILEDGVRTEISVLEIGRPLVVTDRGVAGAGLLERLLDALPRHCRPIIFDATRANPGEEDAAAAGDAFVDANCDGIVGFGGGSVLDLAKIVGLRVTHSGPLENYAAAEGGISRIKSPLPPIIAIPTTAGTGSEVGRGASIVLGTRRKLGFFSPDLVPRVALCDPTLTIALPPLLTAGTGMNAIAQCIETYLATAYNPPADGIALDGLRRAAGYIERAVVRGGDIEARREMMAAAMNGALAIQKGLGAVHAMSEALGGLGECSLHHGTLSAILLPHVLDYNAPAVGHRYGAIKQAMGFDEDCDLGGEITRLNDRIGIPRCLSEIGIDRADIDAAAPLAEADCASGTNPRRASAMDYHDIMCAAL